MLDLCCGSGAMARGAGGRAGRVELHAAELDPVAVRCARRNVPADCPVYEGDLFAALPDAAARTHRRARRQRALRAERLGRPDAARGPAARAAASRSTAAPTGSTCCAGSRPTRARGSRRAAHVLVETSEEQAPAALAAFAAGGLTPRAVTSESDYATVVVGTAARSPRAMISVRARRFACSPPRSSRVVWASAARGGCASSSRAGAWAPASGTGGSR